MIPPARIPDGRHSSVADATGTNWGDVIRGLKPTAKFNRRYATMGIPPTMGGCPDAMMRILGYLRRGAETHWDVGRKPVDVERKPVGHGTETHGPWVVGCRLQPHFCRVAATEFSRGFNPRIVGSPTIGFNPRNFCRVAATEFCRGFQPTDHDAPDTPRRVSDG